MQGNCAVPIHPYQHVVMLNGSSLVCDDTKGLHVHFAHSWADLMPQLSRSTVDSIFSSPVLQWVGPSCSHFITSPIQNEAGLKFFISKPEKSLNQALLSSRPIYLFWIVFMGVKETILMLDFYATLPPYRKCLEMISLMGFTSIQHMHLAFKRYHLN